MNDRFGFFISGENISKMVEKLYLIQDNLKVLDNDISCLEFDSILRALDDVLETQFLPAFIGEDCGDQKY